MPKIGYLRERDGIWEMLTAKGSGEVWSPWATAYVENTLLPSLIGGPVIPPTSIADALIAEGWTPPERDA